MLALYAEQEWFNSVGAGVVVLLGPGEIRGRLDAESNERRVRACGASVAVVGSVRSGQAERLFPTRRRLAPAFPLQEYHEMRNCKIFIPALAISEQPAAGVGITHSTRSSKVPEIRVSSPVKVNIPMIGDSRAERASARLSIYDQGLAIPRPDAGPRFQA
jgi:hypothetical protein